MKIRAFAAATAALALAATPAIANVDRAAAPVEGESELGAGAIFGALAIIGVVVGVIVLVDEYDTTEPLSP